MMLSRSRVFSRLGTVYGPGTQTRFTREGDNQSEQPQANPTRPGISGNRDSYALISLLDVRHTGHDRVFDKISNK